jgi:hypothetical protein
MLWAAPQNAAVPDQRLPAKSSIEKFQKDPAFNYQEAPHGDTFWDKFIRWLRSLFHVKQGSYGGTFLNRDLWYILFAAVIIALIYTFFKSEIKGLFYRSSAANVEMHVLEEDINTLNFDELINDAVKKQNYRYAIRLNYLKNLKELNDNGLIDWKANKTNLDYVKELSGKSIYKSFSGITQLFNWIWYGDFSLTEEEYSQFKTEFVQFSHQLRAKA